MKEQWRVDAANKAWRTRGNPDMTGLRFGRLLVHSKCGADKSGRITWNCSCDCGNKKVVAGTYLRHGNTQSCGCLSRESIARVGWKNLKNLIGKRFCMLVVVERAPTRGLSRKSYWRCLCDCGSFKTVSGHNLSKGSVTSCGCKLFRSGEKHPSWKGGKSKRQGYVIVYNPVTGESHSEHRLVMERVLGRKLRNSENVHHINGIRDDNRPENLELWVKTQPCGARVLDIVAHAEDVLKMYAPEKLAKP